MALRHGHRQPGICAQRAGAGGVQRPGRTAFKAACPPGRRPPFGRRISARCPRPSTNARNFATACPKAMCIAHLYEADATVANVLSHLPPAALTHFACHAMTDRQPGPRQRHHPGRGRPTDLRELLRAQLPTARLAVLSACSSALIGADLQDEVVSFPVCAGPGRSGGCGGFSVGGGRRRDGRPAGSLLRPLADRQAPAPTALARAQQLAAHGDERRDRRPLSGHRPGTAHGRGKLRQWQEQQDFTSPLWWAPFIVMGA